MMWVDRAECRDTDPDLWFPATERAAETAKLICARCPVLLDCDALWRSLPLEQRRHGVYAGQTIKDRSDPDEVQGQDCRRCGTRYLGKVSRRYCSRDCAAAARTNRNRDWDRLNRGWGNW